MVAEQKGNLQWEKQKLTNKIQKAFDGFLTRTGIVVRKVETEVDKVEPLPNGDLKIFTRVVITFASPMELKVEQQTDMGFDSSERREQKASG